MSPKKGTTMKKVKRGHKPEAEPDQEKNYVLRLYVTGITPKSIRAIDNLKEICEEQLKGRYSLEVIDVYQQPDLAVQENIVAMPTLVKQLPAPLRRMVGDLSLKDKVLLGLDLQTR